MAQVIQQAIRLVSGALGAVSFDQLQPGTLVKDEFGRIYGLVVGPYVSPNATFLAVDAAALSVVINVDPSHPTYRVIGEQVAISGRYLEPVEYGPKDPMAGYFLLQRLVLDPGAASFSERVRP